MTPKQVAFAKVLFGDYGEEVCKALDAADMHVPGPVQTKTYRKVPRTVLRPRGASSSYYKSHMSLDKGKQVRQELGEPVKKGVTSITADISKADEEKRQVYGWASITEKDGMPVVDLQGDYITIDEVEKAAHNYLQESRKGGVMHKRADDGEPHHVADLIESVVITPKKKEALGLPEDSPTGWFIGLQVHDEEVWQDVKQGKFPELSVHGRGKRIPKEVDF